MSSEAAAPSSPANNEEIVLESRPQGVPVESDWKVQTLAPQTLKPGEILLQTKYISVDPYLRGRIREHKIGEVMVSGVVAEVIASYQNSEYKEGDVVQGYLPWRRFVVTDGRGGLRKVDPSVAPISTALGVLGMPGMTAYFGLLDVGALKPRETVVVSGAAGAVGSLVGQIAKIFECRVVGTAGGADKCTLLTQQLGFDVAIDYKQHQTIESMKEALSAACPNGIDVYFDNTGGLVTDTVFDLINKNGRVAVCGQISMYNSKETPMAPLFLHKLIYKSVTVKGFVVSDFVARMAEFYRDMSKWVKDGKVKYFESVTDGFNQLPSAFIGLFSGANTGKALVKV